MAVQSINELIGANPDTGTGISNPANEELELGIPQEMEIENPNSSRVIADLSSLPKREEKSTVIEKGVDPVDKILGKGGEFDQYVEEKTQELEQLNESIDRHNEEVAAALGEEVPENITDADVERSKNANLDLKEEAEVYEDETLAEDYVDDMEKELAVDDKEETAAPKLVVTAETANLHPAVDTTINPANVSFEVDDDDFKDIEDDDDSDDVQPEGDVVKLTNEEVLESLQADITRKIASVSTSLNIKSFSRAMKGVRASRVIENVEQKAAEWALMVSGTKISMRSFSGTEIDALAGQEGLSKVANLQRRYKTLYNHIVSDNKPESMEAWVKSLPYSDNDNVFMAVYIASFAGANYIPRDCDKCNNSFLTDNIPISEMYDIEDDEAKERFTSIVNGTLEASSTYVVEDTPISNSICITFRDPSVYSVLFENSYLDEPFADKYRDIISVLAYIDEICFIDQQNQELVPIEYKRFPTNKVKDIKSRIIEYAKIINTLTPDQYSIIIAYINAINSRKSVTIRYQLPECTCPNCGRKLPSQTVRAEDLVFMRHQLAALATTSIK